MDWRGGCVSVWVRETARRRSVEWQRERELWHLSDLGCGEGSWLKHIPQAASDEKAAGQCGGEVATSFKSLRDHIGLPLTSSRLTHCSHRHLLSCVTHQPLNQLCCPVRSKGFPRLRHRDKRIKKTDWGKEAESLLFYSVSVRASFGDCLNVSLTAWITVSGSFSEYSRLCRMFQHARKNLLLLLL